MHPQNGLEDQTERAIAILRPARHIMVFTGAGISTESGIPDFRGPEGLWKTVDPDDFNIDRYRANPELRERGWRMHLEGRLWGSRSTVEPNIGHLAIKRLAGANRLAGVVTQNVDGLHHKSGLDDDQVAELHGNVRESHCLDCELTWPTEEVLGWVEKGVTDPRCPDCGGIVKTRTVMFGEMLPDDQLDKAMLFLSLADAVVVAGSTVAVWPAAEIVFRAARRPIPIVIISRGPTEADPYAAIKLDTGIGEVLPGIVDGILGVSVIPELVIRPLTVDDAEQIHALIRRWERHWGIPRVSTPVRAMEWLTAPSVTMDLDTRSYWDDDRLVSYGLVSFIPSDQRRQLAQIQGFVDPEMRRQGIGTDLITWQIARGRERLDEGRDDLPKAIRATTWEWIDEASKLFARFGLKEVRRFDEMLKTLAGPAPVRPPDGIELVSWERGRDEDALRANNIAFADHWGATPMSMGNWKHLLESPETHLEHSFHALADGQVVGMSLAAHYPDDIEVTGRREGWVRILSVDPSWRGRGLGTALLDASHNSFIGAGYHHSMLRVDSTSLTRANLLYESVGYATLRTILIDELIVSDR